MAGDELGFHFTLENPRLEQNAVVPKISIRLSTLDPAETFDSTVYSVTPDTFTPDFSGKVSGTGLTALTEHGQVLTIVGVSFNSGSVSATTVTPCADNAITVTLSVDAYLVASCISKFTFTGFDGSATGTNALLPGVSGNSFDTTGDWNQATPGTLILQVTDNLLADTDYTFTFTLANPAAPQLLKTITVREDNVIGSSRPRTLTGGALQVNDVSFTTATITQLEDPAHPGNIYEPCGPNEIRVSIQPDKTIYSSCNGVPARIVLSGFSGSSTPDDALTITDSTSTFATSADWDQSAGSITVWPESDMTSGTTYTFSFKLINGQVTFAGHSDIKLTLPHISQKLHDMSGTVMKVTNALITPTAFQSSSQPCALNTISVTVSASFSIRMQCTPMLTITGLTGTTTQGDAATWTDHPSWPQYSVSISSTGAAGYFSSTAAWDQTTGELILILDKDLSGLNQYDAHFQLQNGPITQNAPGLVLSADSIYATTNVLPPDDAIASDNALYIAPLTFTQKYIKQSSQYPCSLN